MSLNSHGRGGGGELLDGGLGGSGSSGGVRMSSEDAEKLQHKRKKKGLCPHCGEVQTHKKHLMRMVPQVCCSCIYLIIYILYQHYHTNCARICAHIICSNSFAKNIDITRISLSRDLSSMQSIS